MNTFDVRNLEQSQWLFWVCAIPFTIVVMAISALIVQNVESLRQGWATLIDYRTGAKSGQSPDEEIEGGEAEEEEEEEEEEEYTPNPRTRRKSSVRFF